MSISLADTVKLNAALQSGEYRSNKPGFTYTINTSGAHGVNGQHGRNGSGSGSDGGDGTNGTYGQSATDINVMLAANNVAFCISQGANKSPVSLPLFSGATSIRLLARGGNGGFGGSGGCGAQGYHGSSGSNATQYSRGGMIYFIDIIISESGAVLCHRIFFVLI